MGSIVLDLQAEVLAGNVPITNLLRKALFVAKMLDLKEFQKWIEVELNGTQNEKDIPSYRVIKGIVKGRTRFGWVAVNLLRNDIEEQLSTNPFGHSVSQLEIIINNQTGDSGFHIPMTAGENQVMNDFYGRNQSEFARFYQISQVVVIIETVKTIILNWTIELVKEGILGEGMTFKPEEKRQAESPIYNNVTNFYGTVTDSQVQQGNSHSSQSTVQNEVDLEAVKKYLEMLAISLPKLSLSGDQQSEISAEIGTIKAQLGSSKPKTSVIQGGLKSVFDILKHTAGHVAAELILHFQEYFPNI